MRSLIGGIRNRGGAPIPFAPTRGGFGTALSRSTGGGSPTQTHLAAMAQVGTLSSIVGRTSEATSQVNWHLYRKARPGQPAESRVEVTSHAALDLWNRPNAFFTRQELVETGQQHYELTGETLWLVSKVGKLPLELWPIRPDRMRPLPHTEKYLAGWTYRSPDGDDIPLETGEVIFIRRPNPLDLYRGLGVVQSILVDLDSARFSAEWNRNFFVNSAEPGGIIQVDKRLSDPEFTEMTTRWREQHQGVAQAHRVAVLEQGKWIERKFSMRDMQFPELRELSSEVIREAFGFPKPLLGTVTDVNRCHDDETEVLTADGWKPFPKVTDADLIATVNPETQRVEYHPPTERFEYDYSGPMIRIQNRMVDVKVTPNHTMLFNTDRVANWRTCRADELGQRVNVMAAVEPLDGLDTPTFHLPAVDYANGHTGRGDAQTVEMDAWLAFLGWVIAEGGILSEERAGGRYVLTLAQKAAENVEHIRGCLARLPFRAHEYGGQKDGCTRWNITGKGLVTWLREHVGTNCQDKRIPRWCFSLSVRQRAILLDAMMRGDGSWDTRPGRTSGYYATQSEQLAEDVMELAFTLGYRASMARHDDQRRERPMFYVHLSPRRTSRVMGRDISTEEYEGKVYSFEVPNHVYVTRRNGRIAIHGNSNAEAAEVVFARWLVVPRLERIKQALNNDLLPMFGRTAVGLEFDYDSPVPDDAELELKGITARTQAYAALVAAGVEPEDAAEAVGLPPMKHITPAPALPAKAPGQEDQAPGEDEPAQDEEDAAQAEDDRLADLLRRTVADAVRGALAEHVDRPHRHVVAELPPPPAPTPPDDGTPPELPEGAGPDLQPVQDQWETALAVAVAAWLLLADGDEDAKAKARHGIAGWKGQLVEQVRDAVLARDLLALTRLRLDVTQAAADLGDLLVDVAEAAARHVVTEAADQGVTVSAGAVDRTALRQTGQVAAATLGDGLRISAAREAARVWGPGVPVDTITGQVADHLTDLTPAQPTEVLGGALTGAQAAGREATMLAGPSAALYAQEVNDRHRCGPCADVDRKWVGNSDDPARPWLALYPVRGYIACRGRDRCRGQLVAVWRGGKDWKQWVEMEPVERGAA